MSNVPHATAAVTPSNPFRALSDTVNLSHLAALIPPPLHGKPCCTEGAAPTVTYAIYAAGAPHLADFARRIGVAIFKIGLSRFGVHNRVAALSRHGYAGYWGRTGHPVTAMTKLAGSDNWFQVGLERPADLPLDTNPNLHFRQRSIQFDLPGVVHPEIVDQALHNLLANRALNSFLRTDTGQIRMRNADIDPASWFHTHYRNIDAPDQLVPARELYIFDPRVDVPLLANGLSKLVAHLGREAD